VATPVDTGKLNKKGKPVMEFANVCTVKGDIADDAEGFDIGPETARLYAEITQSAKTILWNGPMGMFEDSRFATGTNIVRPSRRRNHTKERREEHHRRRR
jgi:phosphoglycerate kinase